MKRKEKIALFIIFAILIGSMIFDKCESNIEDTEDAHFERFEQCMIENGFEYSDANCEYCWEKTVLK